METTRQQLRIIDAVAAQAPWSAPVPRKIRKQAKQLVKQFSMNPKKSIL